MIYFPNEVPSSRKYGTALDEAAADQFKVVDYFVACVEHRMRIQPEMKLDDAMLSEVAMIGEFATVATAPVVVSYLGKVRERLASGPMPDLHSPSEAEEAA